MYNTFIESYFKDSVLALLLIIGLLLIGVMIFLRKIIQRTIQDEHSITTRLDAIEKGQEHTERIVKEEVTLSRDELGKASREQRQELMGAFKSFGQSLGQQIIDIANMQKDQLHTFSEQLSFFTHTSSDKFDSIRSDSATGAKQLREEVVTTLNSISETMTKTIKDLGNAEHAQLEVFSNKITSLTTSSGEKLDGIRYE